MSIKRVHKKKTPKLKAIEDPNSGGNLKNYKYNRPLRSGLWHRLTKRTLSLENPLSGSTTESKASIVKGGREEGQREGIRKMEEFGEEGDVGVETRLLIGKKSADLSLVASWQVQCVHGSNLFFIFVSFKSLVCNTMI